MRPAEIIRRRLANQHLVASGLHNPLQVISTLGAVQAQDFYGALWGLALRLPPMTESQVEGWFTDGRILRLHILRPTWHFVAPADVRWMLALSAPRVHALNAGMYRNLGVDAAAQKRALKIFERSLSNGRQLTRQELAAELEAGGVADAKGQRLAYLVMFAELEGLITSGPRRGKQFTYALLDERAPAKGKPLGRQDALANMARAYFTGRGPATAKDFAWWSGLTVADGRAAAGSLGSELRSAEIEGKTYWWSEARPPAKSARGAWLLPNYDEYGIGFADRSHTVPEFLNKLLSAGSLPFPHFYMVNGRAGGMWKRELGRGEVRITIKSPSGNETADIAALKSSIQKYGKFLGLKPVVATKR